MSCGFLGMGWGVADVFLRYHYFNHYAIFGGGYGQSALGIMKHLCRKYGSGNDWGLVGGGSDSK